MAIRYILKRRIHISCQKFERPTDDEKTNLANQAANVRSQNGYYGRLEKQTEQRQQSAHSYDGDLRPEVFDLLRSLSAHDSILVQDCAGDVIDLATLSVRDDATALAELVEQLLARDSLTSADRAYLLTRRGMAFAKFAKKVGRANKGERLASTAWPLPSTSARAAFTSRLLARRMLWKRGLTTVLASLPSKLGTIGPTNVPTRPPFGLPNLDSTSSRTMRSCGRRRAKGALVEALLRSHPIARALRCSGSLQRQGVVCVVRDSLERVVVRSCRLPLKRLSRPSSISRSTTRAVICFSDAATS